MGGARAHCNLVRHFQKSDIIGFHHSHQLWNQESNSEVLNLVHHLSEGMGAH